MYSGEDAVGVTLTHVQPFAGSAVADRLGSRRNLPGATPYEPECDQEVPT